MAFRSVNFAHLAKFNSDASSQFVHKYEEAVQKDLIEKGKRISHKTFAPSSFRCERHQWFRLRGVEPDVQKKYDQVLEFKAELGTSCHLNIQRRLASHPEFGWTSVSDYLKANPLPYEYTLEEDEESMETRISVEYPPIRFACDGILNVDGIYYLLEIKTAEHSSFNELTDPKPIHVDQIRCYSAILGLHRALVVYQDRQYGDIKCYEMTVSSNVTGDVFSTMQRILHAVDSNLAPARLEDRSSECTSSSCPYFNKCLEWG